MRTLNEQIQRLRDALVTCYNAIKRKGGTIPEAGERTLLNMPAAVLSIPQVHGVLTELEVTADGEYLPSDYDADGFSKVVAMVTPTKRVVIPNDMRVTDNLIIDGYWAGELVDTSKASSLRGMFSSCYSLINLDVSNWDVSNVTSLAYTFNGCVALKSLDVSNWNTSKVITTRDTFRAMQSIKSLDLTRWDASNIVDTEYMFYDQNRKGSLISIIGERTIEDVINNNIGCLNGLKTASSTMFSQVSNLDRASLRALINGLADLTGQTTQTLTIGATLLAKLTEEDIAIATSKNWTIV